MICQEVLFENERKYINPPFKARTILCFLFVFLIIITYSSIDERQIENPIDNYAAYILMSTDQDGGIFLTPKKEKLVPYFSSIAAEGLVDAYLITGNKLYLETAKRYCYWYESHQDKNGVVYDSRSNNKCLDTPCNRDSDDSYASKFVTLVLKIYNSSNDTSFLVEMLPAMDRSGKLLLNLQDKNGLLFAKLDYKVKYLMDNSEVYKGFRALSEIYKILGMINQSLVYNYSANKVRSGILNELWTGKYFQWCKGCTFNKSKFYPDIMAQMFPIIEGVIGPVHNYSRIVFSHLKNLSIWDYKGIKTGYPNSALPQDALLSAEFAWKMGDRKMAINGLKSVKDLKYSFYTGRKISLFRQIKKQQ